MKKTSLYLTDGDARRLADLARREGRSQATIVRDAIRSYAPRRTRDRDFLLFASGSGDGRSVAEVPEEKLLAGFGE